MLNLSSADPAFIEPLGELLTAAAGFSDARNTVLERIEYLGTLAGCTSASWSWTSQYKASDYLSPRRPILSGLVGGPRTRDAADEAKRWAKALGLTASRRALRGTVSYDGELNGLLVQVWAVVDSDAFGTQHSPLKMYAPDLVLAGLLALSLTTTGVLAWRTGVLATWTRTTGTT